MRCKVLKLNVLTGNKVIYPTDVVQREIDRLNNSAHPMFGMMKSDIEFNSPMIDITQVSHAISDLKIEEDYLTAEIKILNTPKGELLQTLFDKKIDIGFTVMSQIGYQYDLNENNQTVINFLKIMQIYALPLSERSWS